MRRAREMTFTELKLCSADINIWACYSFSACFTFSEEKLPKQRNACLHKHAESLPVEAAKHHNIHKRRDYIWSMPSCNLETYRGVINYNKMPLTQNAILGRNNNWKLNNIFILILIYN